MLRRKEKNMSGSVDPTLPFIVPTLNFFHLSKNTLVRKNGKKWVRKYMFSCPRLLCALNPSTLQLCYTVHVTHST